MIDEKRLNKIRGISRNLAYSILRESKDGEGWHDDPSGYQYIRYDIVQSIIHMTLALFTAYGDRFPIAFDDLWDLAGGAYDEAVIALITKGEFDKDGLPIKKIQ